MQRLKLGRPRLFKDEMILPILEAESDRALAVNEDPRPISRQSICEKFGIIGRPIFLRMNERTIDRALQRLRKAGKIRHKKVGRKGWLLVQR